MEIFMEKLSFNPETMQVVEQDGKKRLLTRSSISLQFFFYSLSNLSELPCVRDGSECARLYRALFDCVESLILPFRGDIVEEYFVTVQELE